MTLAVALAGALAPCLATAAGRRALTPEPSAPTRPAAGQGRVAFVTEKRAYLDHGSDGGLTAGQTVALLRGGRPAGSCTVEASAAHAASCVGGRPRVGDTFRLSRVARPAPAPRARALPPVTDIETLQADARAIADAEVHKVDFAGRASSATRPDVALTAGYASWTVGDDPLGDRRQERVDGSLRLPLGRSGLRLDAAFSARRWHPRAEPARFRPGQVNEFYLWEAEVSHRDRDARTIVAVGRVWPWHTPGLAVLDGVQIGRRNEARTVEAGVYGGTLPDLSSLAPTTDAWVGGLYGALRQTGSKGDLLRLAREEARIGTRHLPGTGMIIEAELLAQLWLGWSTVGAGGRVVHQPGRGGPPTLERGYLDLRVQPGQTFGAGLLLRAFGAPLAGDQAPLRGVSPSSAGRYHAAGDAHWDPLSWLGVGLFADVSHDGDAGWASQDGALELRLPRLFGDLGGLWLGAEAAEGWLRSRSLYAQVLGRMWERVRVIGRVTATASAFLAPRANPNTRELDGLVQIDAGISSWLRLRGRALVRAPLAFDAEGVGSTPGLVLDVDATGTF